MDSKTLLLFFILNSKTIVHIYTILRDINIYLGYVKPTLIYSKYQNMIFTFICFIKIRLHNITFSKFNVNRVIYKTDSTVSQIRIIFRSFNNMTQDRIKVDELSFVTCAMIEDML